MSDPQLFAPPADDITQFPRSLHSHAKLHTLDTPAGSIPSLLTHPTENWWDVESVLPAPTVLWFHGRTVNKMLDPGRYLRWKRLGFASCAIDLPGHGERLDDSLQSPQSTLRIAEQQADEIEHIVDALSDSTFHGAFDTSNLAIGGMSAGGMVTLIYLTSGKSVTFRCAVIEASAGDFTVMEGHDFFVPERVQRLNPIDHIDRLVSTPIFAVHSKIDSWVPVDGMTRFIEAAKQHHQSQGNDPGLASVHVWEETGAPYEHMGFGKRTNDTKNMENEFLERHLLNGA